MLYYAWLDQKCYFYHPIYSNLVLNQDQRCLKICNERSKSTSVNVCVIFTDSVYGFLISILDVSVIADCCYNGVLFQIRNRLIERIHIFKHCYLEISEYDLYNKLKMLSLLRDYMYIHEIFPTLNLWFIARCLVNSSVIIYVFVDMRP